MLIAVTGAAGFIGGALVKALSTRGLPARGLVRSRNSLSCFSDTNVENFIMGDIHAGTDWSPGLSDVDCVIHCAARAHIMRETASNVLEAYRAVNVAGTRHLAEQATALGVKRLVCLSSIGVNGRNTEAGARFAHNDKPIPEDAYGVSKWEAEQALREVSARTGLEVVIVRPPLVYGPGLKGNFRRLLRLAASGAPLPLGVIRNQRSLAGLDNLVDLLIHCTAVP